MRKFSLIALLAAYLLGGLVCPCVASAVAAAEDDEHKHHAAHHQAAENPPAQNDCHGLSDMSACSSATMLSVASVDSPAAPPTAGFDDDVSAPADNAQPGSNIAAQPEPAPSVRDGPALRSTPVTRADRLTE